MKSDVFLMACTLPINIYVLLPLRATCCIRIPFVQRLLFDLAQHLSTTPTINVLI